MASTAEESLNNNLSDYSPIILIKAQWCKVINPTKWSNILKQFVGKSWRIAWVCMTILLGWHLNG